MRADSGRYKLGRRLRAFEAAWEKASAAAKKRALPTVQRAVFSFFAGQPSGAAAALDGARLALKDKPVSAEEGFVGTLTFDASRFLSPGSDALEIVVDRFYGDRELPQGVTVELTLDGLEFGVAATTRVAISALPTKVSLKVRRPSRDGDATLFARFSLNGKPVWVEEQTVSLFNRGRVTFIKAPNPLAAEEFRLYNALLSGESPETDVPGAKLISDVVESDSARPAWGDGQPGEFWLSLDVAGKPAPVRFLAPDAAKSRKPLPLVLAMHGAGGSENLFFDGYGMGKLVRLCEKRGWLLVATRSGAGLENPEAFLQAIAKLYPIDRKRVFVVGHSMGAAQACALVQRAPARMFAALACLGGGGPVTKPEVFKTLPLFLGLGEQDFGAGMARGLVQSLKISPKIYPNAEHLTVVQDALPDVVTFFEKAARP